MLWNKLYLNSWPSHSITLMFIKKKLRGLFLINNITEIDERLEDYVLEHYVLEQSQTYLTEVEWLNNRTEVSYFIDNKFRLFWLLFTCEFFRFFIFKLSNVIRTWPIDVNYSDLFDIFALQLNLWYFVFAIQMSFSWLPNFSLLIFAEFFYDHSHIAQFKIL